MKRPATIPENFWDSLGPERQAEVSRIEETLGTLYASGSRLICPASVHAESDWDVYGLDESADCILDLKYDGYTTLENRDPQYGDKAFSLRKGDLNVILFLDRDQFEMFHEATCFCAALGGPSTRDGRIEIFKRFRNEGFDE